MADGKGLYVQTVAGVLLITVFQSALVTINVNQAEQDVLYGVVILLWALHLTGVVQVGSRQGQQSTCPQSEHAKSPGQRSPSRQSRHATSVENQAWNSPRTSGSASWPEGDQPSQATPVKWRARILLMAYFNQVAVSREGAGSKAWFRGLRGLGGWLEPVGRRRDVVVPIPEPVGEPISKATGQ
jgi:hypothetical protein